MGGQRSRLMEAMAEVSAAEGYAAATVSRVVGQAGMSRKTFYEHFPNREACFMAALQDGFRRLHDFLEACCAEQDTSAARLQAAAWEAICLIECEPVLARLCVVEALAAGPAALDARREALGRLAALLENGGPVANPRLVRALVGAGVERIHDQLTGPDRAVDAAELYTAIAYPLLVLVVGADRAYTLSTTPPPSSYARTRRVQVEVAPARPVSGRALDVLTFFARHPGAANTDLQCALGLADAGQVSRLVQGLKRRDLLERLQPRGRRNAWRLTEAGRALAGTEEGA
jgi:AcrR family transcriptional regulator